MSRSIEHLILNCNLIKSMTEIAAKREDLNLNLRHDVALVLDHNLAEAELLAIKADLEQLTFNCAIRKDEH